MYYFPVEKHRSGMGIGLVKKSQRSINAMVLQKY